MRRSGGNWPRSTQIYEFLIQVLQNSRTFIEHKQRVLTLAVIATSVLCLLATPSPISAYPEGPFTTYIVGTGSYNDICVDGLDRPHVAYQDHINGDLVYATKDNGTWYNQVVDSGGIVGRDCSIALDPNGSVHISYKDNTNKNLKYANNTLGYWVTTAVDVSSSIEDIGSYTSIAVDSTGHAHISYTYTWSSGGSYSYATRYANNAGGSWTVQTLTGSVGKTSIAVDSNDKVHITTRSGNSLCYLNNVGGAFSSALLDSDPDGLEDTSIAIDSNNWVHISYHLRMVNSLKYATNAGGSWTYTKIASGGTSNSIAVDRDNNPHIASGTTMFIKGPSGWTAVAVDPAYTWGMQIAFGPSGRAQVSYNGVKYAINTVPPTAPLEVAAASGNGNATITWDAPLYDGGSAITSYKVYKASSPTGSYSLIGTTGNMSYLAEGLTNGVASYFKVKAVNAIGEGLLSAPVQAFPIGVPSAPQFLQAVPGNANVTLTWAAPTSDGGAPIDYYIICQDEVEVEQVNDTSVTIIGLDNGRNYSFEISAHNAAGTSIPSGTVHAIPFTAPDAPIGLLAVPGDSNITLSWTAPFDGGRNIDHYAVFMDDFEIETTTETWMVITGLSNGQSYEFFVLANNIAGNGPRSDNVTGTPYTVPDVLNDLSVVAGDGNVTLTWSEPLFDGGNAIDHYVVYQDQIDVLHVTGTFATISSLINGRTYSFAIAAHNDAGTGELTDLVQVIPYTVPDPPTDLVAVSGNGQVSLSWSAPSFDGGRAIDYYIVYQNGVSVAHPTTTSFTDTGLINGAFYNYTVAAHNIAGPGWVSDQVQTIPLTVPGVVGGLLAVPGNEQVALSWVAPTNDGGSNIDHYIVYQYGVDVGHTSELLMVVSGLVNGEEYVFTVAAHNIVGTGLKCAPISAFPSSVPDPPTGLVAVAGDASAALNWTAPSDDGGMSIDHYAIIIDAEDYIHVNGTSFTVEGLRNGQVYEISVMAHNYAGYGHTSLPVVVIPYGVPDMPIEVTAMPGNANVTLQWTVPTSDGGRAIDHYIVYQDGVDVGHIDGTGLVLEGLLNGQTYGFSVSAHNLAGSGPSSAEVSAIPYTVPDAPTGLNAVSGNANISLNWTAPFDGGRGIERYLVFLDGENIMNVTDSYALIGDLSNGQTYEILVMAYNLAGLGSPSPEVMSTPYTVPDAPTGLTVIEGDAEVILNWTAPFDGGSEIDYYIVYEDGVYVQHVGDDSIAIIGLANGQNYSFSVAAHNQAGEGCGTVAVNAVPFTVPGAPVGLVVIAGDGNVTLTWTVPTFDGGRDIIGYVVYRGTASGTLSQISALNGTAFVDQNVTNGQDYVYAVSAVNMAGEGTSTAEETVTPEAPADGNGFPMPWFVLAMVVVLVIIIAHANRRKKGQG